MVLVSVAMACLTVVEVLVDVTLACAVVVLVSVTTACWTSVEVLVVVALA